MRVFVGEPGYEYKENFRTLSNDALSGGVTSVVTMPNTDPIIDCEVQERSCVGLDDEDCDAEPGV